MAGTPVRSLADGHTKLAILATAPVDPKAPKLTELTSALDASCRIAKTPYSLGPTASETVSDPELCRDVNATVFGASNFEGEISPFRYYDPVTGQVDVTGDAVFQALKTKGIEVWLVERENGKKSTEPFAVGDEVCVYRVLLDNPKKPSDKTGYIKRHVTLAVQEGHLDVKVTA